MLLSIETTSGAVLLDGNPAADLEFFKGSKVPLWVQFLSDGEAFELSASATGSVQVNQLGTFGGSGIGSGSMNERNGYGNSSTAGYTLDLSTTAIAPVFEGGAESVEASLQFKWSYGGLVFFSAIVPVTIKNTLHA